MIFSTAATGGACVASLTTCAVSAIAQSECPNRPARIIVTCPPGGSTDPVARLMAHKSGEPWNDATVVVDNRPGGNTLIGTQIPDINNKKVRPIAITGEGRVKALPHVPTFDEACLPGYCLKGWTCLLAPTGTPLSVRTKVANTWAEIIKAPGMEALMAKQGLESYAPPPGETTAPIEESVASYGKVIADSNIVWKT